MALAVSHPWASASSLVTAAGDATPLWEDVTDPTCSGDKQAFTPSNLSSQSLADSRCNLHATSRSSHSRRSPSCQFVVKSQGTWITWSAVINRTSSGLGS